MRQTLAFCLGLALYLGSVGTAQAGDTPLREGLVRYHYYQGDYLPAVSELLVAREKGRGFAENHSGILLEGAIRLAFGMPESAAERFEQALTGRAAQRDAARFYLGKLHYLNGEDARAQSHWQSLGGALRPELAREARARQALLAVRQGAPVAVGRGAPVAVGKEGKSNINAKRLWRDLDHWAPTVLYNLAGQRARAGDYPGARHYYSLLTDQAPRWTGDDPEYLALRDRAHTAAGFTHLLEDNFSAARDQFARVRLHRPEANRALLGYGWALAESGDYRQALSPWQTLAERAPSDASVQEALLAVPHAYRQLSLSGPALEAYDRAEAALEAQLTQLNRLAEQMTGPQLLDFFWHKDSAPLGIQSRQNWLTMDRGHTASTDNHYLAELVVQSRFQSRAQAIRDLLDQRALIASWQEKLSHFTRLQRDRQARRQSPEAQALREEYWQRAQGLRRQRAPLADRLARLQADRDYLALADAETQSLFAMTERASASAVRLQAAGENIGNARERLRLYRGILLWRAAQNFPDNYWRAKKQLIHWDRALEELAQRRARVREVVQTNPDTGPNLARIARAEDRIQRQLQALDGALAERAQLLAQELQAHLAEHRQRLNHYLARTRLAAARLQDDLLRESTP